jgi:hypothetical protein
VAPLSNLHVVAASRQIDTGPGSVVNLQRLVEAAAFDVLGEKELGWRGRLGVDHGRAREQRREHHPKDRPIHAVTSMQDRRLSRVRKFCNRNGHHMTRINDANAQSSERQTFTQVRAGAGRC